MRQLGKGWLYSLLTFSWSDFTHTPLFSKMQLLYVFREIAIYRYHNLCHLCAVFCILRIIVIHF